MKNSRYFLGALLAAVTASAANVPPVTPPVKRTEALDAARALLAPRDPVLPADARNPFYSDTFIGTGDASLTASAGANAGAGTAAGDAARPTGPRSGRDLLAAIADGLKPSGYIVMGGQPSLSFGQKRVKAGGTLTITFEGSDYTVEVVSIDRTHFSLRLGNETYTRPIK